MNPPPATSSSERAPKSLRYANVSTAGALLVVGGAMALGSLQLPLYTSIGPGPGFFPLWISIGLTLVAAFWLWSAVRPPYKEVDGLKYPDRAGARRIATATLASIGFALLLDPVGFVPTCTVYVAVLLKLLSRVNLVVSFTVGFTVAWGIAQLFSALGIYLPPTAFGPGT